jgi:hypothetical protein
MRPIALTLALLGVLFAPPSAALAAPDWSWPVRGPVLTGFLNGDDPYAAGQHRGIDIGAPVGTPVVAAASGTVVYAGVVGSSGLTVSERAGDYELSYLHLSASDVRAGDQLDAGERIGAVGVSGKRSVDQPHLHFGVRQAADRHAYLDPLRFLAAPSAEAPHPHAAPVAVREPSAAPAPVAVPAPAAVRDAQPVAVPVHAGHAAPAQHGVGTRRHAPAPAHAPLLHARPLTGSSPRASAAIAAGRTSHPVTNAATSRAHAVAHGPVSVSADAPGRAIAPAPPHARHHRGGIDTGWLAACAGLVLAAGVLARPGSRDRGRPSARSAFTTVLRAGVAPARARARQ